MGEWKDQRILYLHTYIPVPAALGVSEKGLGNLRVEHYDIVHFGHSIVASMQSKHISNSPSGQISRKTVGITIYSPSLLTAMQCDVQSTN